MQQQNAAPAPREDAAEDARRQRFNELWLRVIERSEQRAAQEP